MTKKPYIIGRLFLLSGYTWAFLTRVDRPILQELMKFHRREQMQRFKNITTKAIRLRNHE